MMIFGGQVLACSLADRHPSHGQGLRGTNAGSLTAHKVRMPVDEHEFIYVAALSDKGQLQVDIIWGEKDASVAVKGPMPQLRE